MGAGSSGALTIKERTSGLTAGMRLVVPALVMLIETMCSPVVMGVNFSWYPASFSDQIRLEMGEKFGWRTVGSIVQEPSPSC